jgi:hypothetical protein
MRLQVEFFQELVHGQPVMGGNKFQDTFKGSNFDRMMFGNRDVELAVKLGGQADVGTVLPDAFVAQNAQRLEQFWSGDIARRLHAAITSSRTK